MMERFDEAWEYDPELGAELDEAFSFALDPDVNPEELYLSLMAEVERGRDWSEAVWELPEDTGAADDSLLFPDPTAVVQLGKEIRLSELWRRCRDGALSMDEFLELTALVTELDGVPGDQCADCAMLQRPSTPANWSLGATGLCQAHLRFRLGHAKIDRSV
ncbi:MAG TPA: hypothetical protein VEG62_01170 [Acidimicrobiales bacterium]|nr:hypothetical protein [Acidimicrobiales bacterium]